MVRRARVSVVMPAHNAAATLPEQLAALGRQQAPEAFEVVVVENGSTDDTREVLDAYATRMPAIRIVDERDVGVNAARNTGVRACVGDRILLCDADDVVADSWVAELVAALEEFDLVGGRLEFTHLNADRVRRARSLGHEMDALIPGPKWPFAATANLGFRRSVFDAIDGFDRALDGRSGEDIDFCWRAQEAGFAMGFAPDAVVHYRLRSNLRALLRQQYRYTWGRERVLARHRRLGGIDAATLAVRPKIALRRALDALVELPQVCSADRRWGYLVRVARMAGMWRGIVDVRMHRA